MDMLRGTCPRAEEMAKNKYLAPIGHRFLSPELWRFTRRSVPRGVALGLFAAFIIPIGQVFLAAFPSRCLPRANVPLAALATFVTNPFTLPFWLVVANKVGQFYPADRCRWPGAGQTAGRSRPGHGSKFAEFFELAGTTAFGFAVMAVVAPIGGLSRLVVWIWRAVVARKRAKRLKVMEARLDRRLGSPVGTINSRDREMIPHAAFSNGNMALVRDRTSRGPKRTAAALGEPAADAVPASSSALMPMLAGGLLVSAAVLYFATSSWLVALAFMLAVTVLLGRHGGA